MKRIKIFLIYGICATLVYSCGARQEKKVESVNKDTVLQTENLPKYGETEIPLNDSTTKILKDTVTELSQTEKTNNTKKKVVSEPDTMRVMVETQDGKLKKTTVSQEMKESANSTKRFYVIAGTFSKEENAKKLDKFFKSKGYKSQIIGKTDKYYRTAVFSSKTKKEAAGEIKKLRTKYKDINFWLLWR